MKPRKLRNKYKSSYSYGKYIKYHFLKRTCKNIKYKKIKED